MSSGFFFGVSLIVCSRFFTPCFYNRIWKVVEGGGDQFKALFGAHTVVPCRPLRYIKTLQNGFRGGHNSTIHLCSEQLTSPILSLVFSHSHAHTLAIYFSFFFLWQFERFSLFPAVPGKKSKRDAHLFYKPLLFAFRLYLFSNQV